MLATSRTWLRLSEVKYAPTLERWASGTGAPTSWSAFARVLADFRQQRVERSKVRLHPTTA
jgi:hypothetical protein